MMLAEPATRSATRQHWWKALLAFSLALNLFFCVGALWIRVHAPVSMPTPADRLEQMSGELGLDAGQRQAFVHYSQAMRQRLQAMHRAVQPLLGDAWSEVARPHSDEAKVMQFFDQAAQERRGFMRELTTATLSFLATLSPEQRAKFVRLAQQRPRPWWPPHERDGSHSH